jgi:hypothetical protein
MQAGSGYSSRDAGPDWRQHLTIAARLPRRFDRRQGGGTYRGTKWGCVAAAANAATPAERQSRLRHRLARGAAGLALVSLLSGCLLEADKPDIAIDVPEGYKCGGGAPVAALPALDWWSSFRSGELTVLIEEAQAANLDIASF